MSVCLSVGEFVKFQCCVSSVLQSSLLRCKEQTNPDVTATQLHHLRLLWHHFVEFLYLCSRDLIASVIHSSGAPFISILSMLIVCHHLFSTSTYEVHIPKCNWLVCFVSSRSWKSRTFLLEYKKKPFVPDAVAGHQISQNWSLYAAVSSSWKSSLQRSSYPIAGLEDGTSDGSAL